MNDTVMTKPQFDRTVEDLGNIVELGHVNVTVPDQSKAIAFYLMGLGLTRDPYLMAGLENMWVNVGRGQFHLPTRNPPQVVRGTTGLVVPDLEALLKRLEYAKTFLEGTKFSYKQVGDVVETTCPWGNRMRVHGPEPENFGPLRLGMPYVEFDIAAGTDLSTRSRVLHRDPRRHCRRVERRARTVCLGEHLGRQQGDLSRDQEEAAAV